MVKRLCRDGDGVAVVAGRAGTGKTFALGAAREAWQAAGHPVLGVAIARRAADELREGAGIQSTSTFALLADLRSAATGCRARCVLVVDEAGMVPTREIAELLDHVAGRRGQARARRRPSAAAGAAGRRRVPRAGRSAGSRSSSARTSARSTPGSATRSTSSATAAQSRRSAAYAEHDRLTVEPTGERRASGSSLTGSPPATRTRR